MSKPDEKAIERDFCAGVLSQQDVADKYGITFKALRYMAEKKGWVRKKLTAAEKKMLGASKGQKTGAKKKEICPKKNAPKTAPKAHHLHDERLSNSEDEILTEEIDDLGFEPSEFGLTGKQSLFVYWYIITRDRVTAYRKAGYKCEGSNVYPAASQIYRNINVAKAITVMEKRVSQRYTANLDELVDQLVAITRADPNLVSQYRRVNCRYCWGEDHRYQYRDDDEYDRAEKKAAKDGKSPPEYGGVGFISNVDPNPECPRCNGEGVGEIKLGDTRDLSGDERAFYLGVKQTKNGIEVITESKQAARAMLLRILESRKDDDDLGVMNVMPVPTAGNVDEWEKQSQALQNQLLKK